MHFARQNYSATLLRDGRVLVEGGLNGFFDPETAASAELFDPATGTWTETGSLNTGRYWHSATLLDDGRVLLAGGDSAVLYPQVTAELYDPSTGAWTATGSLKQARRSHTATLLPNGEVLVVAGYVDVLGYPGYPIDSAELYDPATGSWSLAGNLPIPRESHTATLLANGKVLVAGGINRTQFDTEVLADAELYDPASGTWTATGSLAEPRTGHTATLLPNGKVLVAGGYGESGLLASAELYDPESETWTQTGSLATARDNHTATLLGDTDGKVLVAGGYGQETGFLASAELYDPTTERWSTTASLAVGRVNHTATLMLGGDVLIAGGRGSIIDNHVAIDSAELFVHLPTLMNISSRLDVQTGDDVMIGGFIVTGTEPQVVIVRGIGPSTDVPGALSDPVIDLFDATGQLLATNDNWQDDPNQQEVINNGLAPADDAESALWETLDPGAYTVVLSGKNGGTGVGLVEVYRLSGTLAGALTNISTRGLVQTDDNVLIGGLIVGQGTGNASANVLLRALGPSLPVPNALANPTLELYDESGTLIDSNDDWKLRSDGSSQQAEIEATTIPPGEDSESALLETLAGGSYTAIVRGKDNIMGVGLVEIYNLQQ